MAIEITAPRRSQQIIKADGTGELRLNRFLEEVADSFGTLPDVGAAVTDATGATAAGNETKINELLASLRAAGIIST